MTAERNETMTVCARHPNTETALRCGRCETYICPRCLVYTSVGVRCPDCVEVRRLPMYELGPSHYARAVGAAAVLTPLLGLAAYFVLYYAVTIRFAGILIGLAAGAGAGSLVALALTRATGGKRGVPLQVIGSAVIVGTYAIRLLIMGARDFNFLMWDAPGIFALIIGIVVLWQRLR